MPLAALDEAIELSRCEVISTDLFDTVLLRDHTIESDRLATACRRAADRLGLKASTLTRLRWDFHDSAYRAVAIERPHGEASLGAICRTISASLGLGYEAAKVIQAAEVEVDIEHLSANRPLLEVFARAQRSGRRVIAVSDTYYDEIDLRKILDAVVGENVFAAVYSSADIGLTKHAGGIFAEVAAREGVAAERFLHLGDNHLADVEQARAARWTAVHLPRDLRFRGGKGCRQGAVTAAEDAQGEMSRERWSPQTFGRDVLGPIVAEFCLRLWSLGSLTQRSDDVALLFCARGGLRMQLAFERFLASSGLEFPVHVAPLMVSRVAAVRPALMRTVRDGLTELMPSVAATLQYEFTQSTLSQVAVAVSGVAPSSQTGEWDVPLTAGGFAALLRHPAGGPVVEAVGEQADLFSRHVRQALGDRRHAVLVDTGLFGSTRQLLDEGMPDLDFSSVLIARSYRPGPSAHRAKTFGLQVDADGYSPLRRRTALLRYWHFVEWLFEPELSSVRTFRLESDGPDQEVVRSNLEIPGWQDLIQPSAGTPFHGVIEYLDALPHGPAERIVVDADRAWNQFRRAVVWPARDHGEALAVGLRSHDFGTDATWSAREWQGPVAALRGSTMWREGEIARSGSPLRMPLLAAIETAYGVRLAKRVASRARRP